MNYQFNINNAIKSPPQYFVKWNLLLQRLAQKKMMVWESVKDYILSAIKEIKSKNNWNPNWLVTELSEC